ncbi:hypothetical protein WK53_19685 [Burkholderia ubonensis]|uniref:Uncharacterized protein n=1 Tax=Burkholderia ubonensis TaxID=101571 RepID=A0AAW3N654_9BURK|nr:hypothetical protein WK53_19685 [Burkholderia ubonensis]
MSLLRAVPIAYDAAVRVRLASRTRAPCLPRQFDRDTAIAGTTQHRFQAAATLREIKHPRRAALRVR